VFSIALNVQFRLQIFSEQGSQDGFKENSDVAIIPVSGSCYGNGLWPLAILHSGFLMMMANLARLESGCQAYEGIGVDCV
jgi:hypothetical protein